MPSETLVALLTTVCSVLVKVVGMPDQIRRNFVYKSTNGLSIWFIASTLISYSLWVVHGIQVHDEALIIGQGLGAIATSIILWQVIIYRHNQPEKVNRSKPIILWYATLLDRARRGSRKL